MKKRIMAALLLATVSVTGLLAGCTDKQAVQYEEENYGEYPIKADATLSFWSTLPSNVSATAVNVGETEFAKELEKQTGIKVNYLHPAAGQDSEAFSLMIASNELPDIVQHNWQNTLGGPTGMIEDKVILPLNDLIEDHAPNLKKYLSENPDRDREIKTDDGQYYVFPLLRDDKSLLLSAGPVFRKDWLDDLGLDVPQTITEWETTLRAFKNEKGATAPLSVSPLKSTYLYFIFNSTPDFYVDNGVVKLGCLEPEFKETIITLRKWFKEGLLDKNYISADDQINTYNILNGEAGATFGSGGSDLGKWLAATGSKSSSFELIGAPYPSDKDGNPNSFAPIGDYFAPYASAAITTNCKYPVLATKWLDYAYGQEGHMLFNFGIEGVSYEMISDYPTYTEIITNNPDDLTLGQALSRYNHASYGGPFIQDKRYIEQYYQLEQQKNALTQWLKSADASYAKKMPQLTLSTEESSEYASLYNEIVKYRDERIAAFISGAAPMDEYDKFIETLKSLNTDKVIAIQQSAYDRFQNR